MPVVDVDAELTRIAASLSSVDSTKFIVVTVTAAVLWVAGRALSSARHPAGTVARVTAVLSSLTAMLTWSALGAVRIPEAIIEASLRESQGSWTIVLGTVLIYMLPAAAFGWLGVVSFRPVASLRPGQSLRSQGQ